MKVFSSIHKRVFTESNLSMPIIFLIEPFMLLLTNSILAFGAPPQANFHVQCKISETS